MNITDKLSNLYNKQSKHSNYQILPSNIKKLLNNTQLEVSQSRYEDLRLKYILNTNDFKDKSLVDIGGNTGFFTFEAINNGARKANYYEGNIEHANFVQKIVSILELNEKINVHNEYYNFTEEKIDCDIMLLLNVIHHLGDDFGNKNISLEKAKETMIKSLKSLSKQTNILILQVGFNWKGNISFPLFKNGTKDEMIQWLKESLENEFEFLKIGIASKKENSISYEDQNIHNIKRDNSLGEFMNRPIFILKSKDS